MQNPDPTLGYILEAARHPILFAAEFWLMLLESFTNVRYHSDSLDSKWNKLALKRGLIQYHLPMDGHRREPGWGGVSKGDH